MKTADQNRSTRGTLWRKEENQPENGRMGEGLGEERRETKYNDSDVLKRHKETNDFVY